MSASNQITFILDNIENYQLLADEAGDTGTVFILDSSTDAIKQMADILSGYSDISAVHIISHGDSGLINLGLVQLSNNNIGEYADELSVIGSALSEDGDILVYGCDVAGDESGKTLIATLAEMTGADIAASDDITGAADKGGNWVLETKYGEIEASTISSADFSDTLSSGDISGCSVTGYYWDGSDWIEFGATTEIGSGIYWDLTAGAFFSAEPATGYSIYIDPSNSTVTAETYSSSVPTLTAPVKLVFSGGTLLEVTGITIDSNTSGDTLSGSVTVGEKEIILDPDPVGGGGNEDGVWEPLPSQSVVYSFTTSNSDDIKDITFDFESNISPANDDGTTAELTATQTIDGETLQITSSGEGLVIVTVNTFLAGGTAPDLEGNVVCYDMMDYVSNGDASTQIDVSLVSGKYFTLTSFSLYDQDSTTYHPGETITITSSTGAEYEVVLVYDVNNCGFDDIDFSGVSGFSNITGFSITANGAPMAIALDNIELTNISSSPVYTAPTLTATGATPTFTEGGSTGVDLFETVTASTEDSGQDFTGFTVTVTNVADAAEYLTIGGTDVALTNGNSVSLTSGTASVSVSGGTATVTVTGLAADNTAFGSLIDGMTYKNSAADATAGNRVVTITDVTDAGSSDNTAITNIGATVTVADNTGVNNMATILFRSYVDGLNYELMGYNTQTWKVEKVSDSRYTMHDGFASPAYVVGSNMISLTASESEGALHRISLFDGTDYTYYGPAKFMEIYNINAIGNDVYFVAYAAEEAGTDLAGNFLYKLDISTGDVTLLSSVEITQYAYCNFYDDKIFIPGKDGYIHYYDMNDGVTYPALSTDDSSLQAAFQKTAYAEFNGTIYISTAIGDSVYAMYKYDNATEKFVQITYGTASVNLTSFVVYNNELLYISKPDSSSPTQIYRVDASDTVSVFSSYFDTVVSMKVINDELFVVGEKDNGHYNIFKYYTDEDEFLPVTFFSSTVLDNAPCNLTYYDGKIYFLADDGSGTGPGERDLYAVDFASLLLVEKIADNVDLGTEGLYGEYYSNAEPSYELSVYEGDFAAYFSNVRTLQTGVPDDISIVAPDLELHDVDGTLITGATVTLGGKQTGDSLSFTEMYGITGGYDFSTGVLTLSGTATIAQYQEALRTVTLGLGGVAGDRDILFQATDENGKVSSDTNLGSIATIASAGSDGNLVVVDFTGVMQPLVTQYTYTNPSTVEFVDAWDFNIVGGFITMMVGTMDIAGGCQELNISSVNGVEFEFQGFTFQLNNTIYADMTLTSLIVEGYKDGEKVATQTIGLQPGANTIVLSSDFNAIDSVKILPNVNELNSAIVGSLDNFVFIDRETTVSDTAPTLTATGETPTFNEGDTTGVDLFENVAASTEDSGQLFTGFTITVTNVSDSTEILTILGQDIELTDGFNFNQLGVNVDVDVTGGTATITVTGLLVNDATLTSWIDGMTYKNTGTSVTTGDREITITEITDNGTSSNTASLSVSATVTVSGPTNDAAVLDLNGATAGTDHTVALADASDGLAPDVTISDTENDTAGWDGGSLTIHRVDSDGDADGNVHDVFGFASGSGLTVTGSIVEGADSSGTLASGGTVFATWSYDSSAGELVVSFNSDATSALVQAAAAAITYTNDKPYGDAKIEFALNDGTETTTAEVTVTSNIIHVTQTDYDTDGDTADGLSLYEALAIAKDGDTILLDDGVYRGQFNITKNVTIDAANGADGNVTIESPDSADLQQVLPDMLTNNGHWRMPVLNVDTDDLSGTVTIKNITIDGRDQGLADGFANNKDLLGIGIVDSNVVIDGVTLTNFRCTDSGEWGWGENFPIMAEGSADAGGTVSVSILNSDISNYQKTGIIGWGPSLDITVDGTTITGSGIAGIAGQNGIQIGSGGDRTGTTATITDNVIQNLGFDSDTYSSSGVVLVYADDTTITGNTISGVSGGEGNLNGVDIMNAYDSDTEINISGNTFTDVDTAIVNEPDNAYSLIVGSNDFSGATVAFYDAYDISDPDTETPVETSTVINITSSAAPASGVLSYYMFGGDDTFTDNGSVDSIVYGGAGDDTITTGSGDDVLVGGLGDDTLTGGDGADVFMFQPQEMNNDGDLVMYNVTDYGTDLITDFTQSDTIRIAGADFTDYTAVNGDGLNVAADTIEVVYDSGTDTTSLYIDTDGVAGADMQINLSGEISAEQLSFSGTDITLGAKPVLDLNGGATGTDATVSLASAADGLFSDVTISDVENDTAGWNGGSLTIHRVDSDGDADGNVHDVFGFASDSGLTVTGSIAEGADSTGTLASGGTTFATWSYDSSAGELVLSFNANATSELVEAAAAAITYSNDTPYGDADLKVALSDGTKTTESTVTVTSNIIHVTQTDYDTDGDTADGMSLYEALAIAKDGDTILLHDGVYRGQFNITANVTIDALNGADGNVTIESPDSADLQQVLPDQLTNNGRWRMPVINIDTGDLSGTVTIKNITVDGRDQALVDEYNGNKDFMGIAAIDSNVVIDNVVVKNIRSDASEEQWGFSENYGIFVEGSSALGDDVAQVTITNSEIYDYQKAGIIAWGSNLNVTITDNEITGIGVDGVCGQNGIQIGSGGLRTGTTATITGNTIQNLGFVNDIYTAGGILLVYADDVTVNDNIIKGVEGGAGNFTGIDVMYVYDIDTQIDISGNTFADNDIALVNESDDAFTLNVGSNDFSGATVAFYDSYDIDDPSTETPVENSTHITLTSVHAPESGTLSYYLYGGDDSFTDNGSVDSIVYAGAGDDTITTGSGDDVIVGGLGNDTLTGGDGADIFLYQSQELNADGDRVMYNVTDFGEDTITDFTESDVIRVEGVDFDNYTAVDGDGLNVAANTMELVQADGNTTLYIDTDGVAGADLSIVLEGSYTADSFTFNGTDIGLIPNVGITSATYNAATGVLTVTGFGLTAGDVIDASKLSLKGEGGNSYTLAGTYTVTATADGFALTLNAADQLNVEGILNSNGTTAAGGTTFNIAAEAGWNVTKDAAADISGNAVTVSSLAAPAISGISYNAETGVITVTGSNFVKQPGAANDIDVSKFTFTGQGGNVTLSTTSDVEISSATTFTITLSSEDKALVNAVLDKNGTASSGGTTYNLSAADDWNGPVTGSNTSDTTNAVTVSSVMAVETVDGVPVTTETVTQTQTYTDLNGNTVTREVTTETLTVAPVSDTRVNDTGATDTAEIPLFWGESSRTEWATTASLPVGVGITTTGTRSPVDERTLNDAIGDLLYFIDTTASSTDAGRTAMLAAGAGFLDSMADSASTLIVNKITLTVSGTDVPGSPIIINGTPNSVTASDGTATPKEAIVIDASALPAGTELDLQNIEFAVIIGDGVIVRGGDGANIVFAGEGSQDILLGADDDELHAGAGDDIVGSLGGNDIIYGESGNDRMSGGTGNDFMHGGSGIDTVVYTGSMSDYIITRDHGLTYVSPVSDPSEVDTLVNAEKIEFSDGTYDIQNSDELTFIASLYEQILDRQPEINGFQYWADAVFEKDLSVGDMTVWFMKSAEYHDATGVDFATLSVSDQVEQLYVALLGRPSDADGKAYWIDCVEQGHTIAEVAESFVTSVEMQGIYNLPNEWDFTA